MEIHVVTTGRQTAEDIASICQVIHPYFQAVHIREKNWNKTQIANLASKLITDGIPAAKIRINGHPQLSRQLGIGGVHLAELDRLKEPDRQNIPYPQSMYKRSCADSLNDSDYSESDMNPLKSIVSVRTQEQSAVQQELQNIYTVGRSVHSLEAAKAAELEGMDYIFYGHIYETASKPGVPARGLQQLRKICSSVSIPVIAIGGIQPQHLYEIAKAGAAGVAVMSGILEAADPCQAMQQYHEELKKVN